MYVCLHRIEYAVAVERETLFETGLSQASEQQAKCHEQG